jgi:hypothetical protein
MSSEFSADSIAILSLHSHNACPSPSQIPSGSAVIDGHLSSVADFFPFCEAVQLEGLALAWLSIELGTVILIFAFSCHKSVKTPISFASFISLDFRSKKTCPRESHRDVGRMKLDRLSIQNAERANGAG